METTTTIMILLYEVATSMYSMIDQNEEKILMLYGRIAHTYFFFIIHSFIYLFPFFYI